MTATDRLTHSALLNRILASSRRIAALDPTLGAARTGEDGVSLALVITPGGAIGLHEDGEYLKGDVNLYHNIHRRLDLPPHAAPEDIAEWVREHAPGIVTVCGGMDQSWNSRNMMETLTAEAVALAVQWAGEAETEHGTDAVLVVDDELVRKYGAQVWRSANEDEE